MLGDAVRVRYMVGSRVEDEVIKATRVGGSVRIGEGTSGAAEIIEETRKGAPIRRAYFNRAFMVAIIEEPRR